MNIDTSPRSFARIGGALYLAIILISIFGEGVLLAELIVAGDSAATTNNILASMSSWRLKIAFDFVLLVCAVGLVFVFYNLLKTVNQKLAILAVLFNLISVSIEGASKVNLFSILALLENPQYVSALSPEYLHAQVGHYLTSYSYAFSSGMLFFGFEWLIFGFLMYKSNFIPKTIGLFMVVAGCCYILNTFIQILAPNLFHQVAPNNLLPAFLAEIILCCWLLFKGIILSGWEQREFVKSNSVV